jgi:hypothetical protein
MAYVYRHIRLDKNRPFYIGIGRDSDGIYKRANDSWRRGKLWKRIAAFGYEVEILFDDIDIDFAKEKEKEFIALYKRINDGGCLANISGGGDGYFNHTNEHRDALINRNKGNKHHLGKNHNNESKRKIGASSSIRNSGIKNPSYKGVVFAYRDGVLFGNYISASKCGEILGVSLGDISSCINGKRKTANGFTFKRINNENKSYEL